ncbi:MAG: hypothetical protein GY714_09175 [Desulfobacterales bacterium]|nr:hypothetical protein [Desulfobacterales bacterium]
MEKMADNYYRFNESKSPSEGVKVDFRVDKIDGEDLDTEVELKGRFAIIGHERGEFLERLGNLIDEFRI